MCGRFTLVPAGRELEGRYRARVAPEALDQGPRYNAAPTQQLPILTGEAPRLIVTARWGLVPYWVRDPGKVTATMINARAETAFDKPSFAPLIREARQRCLVPISGFYEWGGQGPGPRQPHYITLEGSATVDGAGIVSLAGLWTTSPALEEASGGPGGRSFTILTHGAGGALTALHDRQPLLLTGEEAEHFWLHEDLTADDLERLIGLSLEAAWRYHPVSRRVSRAGEDYPELIEPLVDEEPSPTPKAPAKKAPSRKAGGYQGLPGLPGIVGD